MNEKRRMQELEFMKKAKEHGGVLKYLWSLADDDANEEKR